MESKMENVSILIVEDDIEINNLITEAVAREGCKPVQAFDGKQALQRFDPELIKLVVLDIMLPYMDGMEVLRRIRECSTVHVIILSAKSEETDRIIGLGIGADDYMTKPFSVSELTARIKAHLRRSIYYDRDKQTHSIVKHGELNLDLDNYTVMKKGEAIPLTPKEFELLKLFFLNPGRVFTKAQIFNQVWDEDYLGDDNTVMVHIRRLRNKIEDNPDQPGYIQTVWGIGYKLGDI